MTPATKLIDHITSNQEARHSWLLDAGAQARRMNEQSRIDPQDNQENAK